MAVFAGGWTLPDAVAVAGEDADEFEVLDLLTRLRRQVVRHGGPRGRRRARYSTLETVRQFAPELLNQSPERDAVRDRHLDRFIQFTAAYERSRPWSGSLANTIAPWIASSRTSSPRTRGAAGLDRARRGMALILPLQRYWPDRGLLELGLRIVRETLARGDQSARTVERSRSLAALSDIHYFRGAYAESLLAGRDAPSPRAPRRLARDADGARRRRLRRVRGVGRSARGAHAVRGVRAGVTRAERVTRLTSALTYLGEILRSG